MEYQPIKINHETYNCEPILNEHGTFLTLQTKEEVIETLHTEATNFIKWKSGGEKASNATYEHDALLDDIEPGYFIRKSENGESFILSEKIMVSGIVYNSYVEKTLMHYKFMTSTTPAHKKLIKKQTVKQDPKYSNYNRLLFELKGFQFTDLKPVDCAKPSDSLENLIEEDLEFTYVVSDDGAEIPIEELKIPELKGAIKNLDVSEPNDATTYSSSDESNKIDNFDLDDLPELVQEINENNTNVQLMHTTEDEYGEDTYIDLDGEQPDDIENQCCMEQQKKIYGDELNVAFNNPEIIDRLTPTEFNDFIDNYLSKTKIE